MASTSLVRPPRSRLVPAAAILAGALTLSACVGGNTGGGDGDGDASAVTIVLPQEPPTLEACDSSLTSTGVVTRSNITEPLIERNPTTGDLEPLLATEWEATGDSEWTFTLREDVAFSDGTPFDSAAVVHSIERALSPDLNCDVRGNQFPGIEVTADAVDPTTVVLSTATPDPILPLRMSFVEIVSPSISADEQVRIPVGTGPYNVDNWNTGVSISLERNDDYWGEQPAFDAAEYVWRGEGTVRASMVNTGEADIAMGLGPNDGAGDNGVAHPNNETTALRLDATQPPLDDVRVREAINYAIDRDGLVNALFEGTAEPAAQLIPDGVTGFDPEREAVPYDPAQAEQLLEEAAADGAPVDTPITIYARNEQFPRITETVEVIQSQLSDIGLNVSIQMLETAQHLEYQVKPYPEDRGANVLLIMHGNQSGDGATSMAQYMRTDSQESTIGDETLDGLVDASYVAPEEERDDTIRGALTYADEELVPFAYLAHMTGLISVGPDVAYEPDSATADELRLAEITAAE